jgi:hypothetical protein
MKMKVRRAEDRLICLCTGSDFDEDTVLEIKRLSSNGLDWNYLLKKSQNEGVSLLTYHYLEIMGLTKQAPPYLIERWQREYYANSARNTLILAEAKRILNILESEKIKSILLKGVFLAEHVYKNIALRQMSDIDILIQKNDVARVNIILVSLGYIQPKNYEEPSNHDLERSSINTLVYNKNGTCGFFIHLHWHLINTTWPVDTLVDDIDMERIWSYAEPIGINGCHAFVLSPEHHLIYLACHGFNHCFDRLILVSDILEFLRCYRGRIDWRVVIEEAERFNVSRLLYYSLTIASRRLGYDIPEFKKIEHDKISSSEKILSFLINKEKCLYISAYLAYLLMQDGWVSKLRFIKRTFFPSTYVMAHSFSLPISKIKAYHYYQRIVNNLAQIIS